MTSTYLGYQLYANNLTQSLARVDNEAANKSAKAYYEANIGKVKTVDDLVNNYRLFSYVTKAYGLEDMTYAKSFLRKVLTSDLSDPTSLANRLNDSRYRTFAQAFGFTTSGTLAKPSIQTASQQTSTIALFQSRTSATLDPSDQTAAVTYYKAHIGSVGSVQALEADKKLTSFVLNAYGLDATNTSAATIDKLLEGSLSDPKSLVNTTAGAGYGALNAAVNVSSTGGTSTVTAPAQSNDAIAATVAAYMAAAPSDSSSQSVAKTASSYYSSTIATITTVDQLLGDPRLMSYLNKAFGLPSSVSPTTLRQILTSDPSDRTSVAAMVTDPALKAFGQAFSFGTDGNLKPLPFQSAAQQNATAALYAARQSTDTTTLDADTAYYRSHIGAVTSVTQLESDSRLYNYVLSAYGVDPAATARSTVEQVLEQNPADPTSVVATTAGAQSLAFANAFAVDSTGTATGAPAAQSASAITAATSAYLAAAKADAPSQLAAKTETAYYKARIASVTSIGEMLGDPRLVGYIVKAYGLPSGTTADQLRGILQASTTAAASLTNRYGSAVPTLRAAFSFGSNGLLNGTAQQGVQNAAQIVATEKGFSQISMEDEAGNTSDGVRLALYLQRKASTITSAYTILADKALAQVFGTLLNLPAGSSKADIDVQASYLASKINFADFKDPAKVNKMVQRYAAMYDLANPDSTTTDEVSLLFGSSSS